MIVNQNFMPKRRASDRLPPGQYQTDDFPVLSLGPTPDIDLDQWKFRLTGLVPKPLSYTWTELNTLPKEDIITDIHCVTKWSKFDTKWQGISLDYLFRQAGLLDQNGEIVGGATHIVAKSYDNYTTNLPIEDCIGGQAWLAVSYQGDPIESEHGGPARLFVPHLYFWKSAKWVHTIEVVDHDIPGFWETKGYHNYGDPWKEQRYTND